MKSYGEKEINISNVTFGGGATIEQSKFTPLLCCIRAECLYDRIVKKLLYPLLTILEYSVYIICISYDIMNNNV